MFPSPHPITHESCINKTLIPRPTRKRGTYLGEEEAALTLEMKKGESGIEV